MNNTAGMNVSVHACFHFSWVNTKSGVARSYSNSTPHLWGNFQTVFQSSCTIRNPCQSGRGFQSLHSLTKTVSCVFPITATSGRGDALLRILCSIFTTPLPRLVPGSQCAGPKTESQRGQLTSQPKAVSLVKGSDSLQPGLANTRLLALPPGLPSQARDATQHTHHHHRCLLSSLLFVLKI